MDVHHLQILYHTLRKTMKQWIRTSLCHIVPLKWPWMGRRVSIFRQTQIITWHQINITLWTRYDCRTQILRIKIIFRTKQNSGYCLWFSQGSEDVKVTIPKSTKLWPTSGKQVTAAVCMMGLTCSNPSQVPRMGLSSQAIIPFAWETRSLSNPQPDLVGGWKTYPSEKYAKVSWDADIPNIHGSHKIHVPNNQPEMC